MIADMFERGDSNRNIDHFKLTEESTDAVLLSIAELDHYSRTSWDDRMELSVSWHPGARIWQAVARSREDTLSLQDRHILAQARSALAAIIRPGMSDLEKERAIHDYICEHCSYLIDETRNTHNCYGFFDHGLAQCSGYSDTFLLLCRLEELWVCVVSGDAMDGDPIYDTSHSWNLIYLGDQWYLVDVTWDDDKESGSYSYAYFNVPQDLLSATRTWNRNTLPEGRCARALDNKWGYWSLPRVAAVTEAVDRAADALSQTDEITLWLADGLSCDLISQRIADKLHTTVWYSELLDKSWARVARFSTHG